MKSPAERLILTIAKLGGSASRRNIARAHLTGPALEQALRETAGLVVWEPVYLKRKPTSPKASRVRSYAARLTAKGIWKAAALGARFDPDLITRVLATVDIKELFERVRHERNPIWLEIEKDRDDAAAYRRLLADEQRMLEAIAKKPVRRKRKMTLRRLQRLNAFLASRGKPPAFGGGFAQLMQPTYEVPSGKFAGRPDVSPPPILPAHMLPKPPVNPPPAFTTAESPFCPRCNGDLPKHLIGCPLDGRTVPTPQRTPRLSPTSFCERCHMSGDLCRCLIPVEGKIARQEIHRAPWALPEAPPNPPMLQRETVDPKKASLVDKIQQAGFTVRNGKVLYGGEQWLTAEEWRQKMPHVVL